MIPHKLHIKNFLSYGPTTQVIDFSSYPLICLAGKNGHGKSALLDAMTWALWGQARKISGAAKADQGLLHLGQTQMLVIFDFAFGNKKYRIRREYMETYGKPINSLEFGIINDESNEFITLTDKTLRTTQEKIEQTLRLDFESFSNSAFLRQGSSNEFSKKSPKDRKQILATILGLDQYEVIRKQALEKVKNAQTQKNILTTLQDKRKIELDMQKTLDAEQEKLNEEMASLSLMEKELIDSQSLYTKNRSAYEIQQRQFHNLTFQLQQLQKQAITYKEQLNKTMLQWRTVNKKKSLYNIYNLEQEKNQVIIAITQHQKLFQENLEHRQKLFTIIQQINAIEQTYKDELTKKNHILHIELERLITEQKSLQNSLLNNEKQIQQYRAESRNLDEQIAYYKQDLSNIKQSDELAKQETSLEKRKSSYQHYVSLGNWISNQLYSLTNKKKLVNENDPSCPLCRQNLSASRKRFLKLNFEKQESFLMHRLHRLKKIIPALKDILIHQHAQMTTDKERINHAAALHSKINELTAIQTNLTHKITELTSLSTQQHKEETAYAEIISTKKNQIKEQSTIIECINDATYLSLKQQKQLIEKSLENHTYKEHDYQKDQKKLESINNQLAQYESLNQEIAQQENKKNDIKNICTALKNIKIELRIIENQRTELGNLTEQLYALEKKEEYLAQQTTLLKKKKELFLHNKGSIENQQKQLTKIKIEFEQEQNNIHQLNEIINDYQAIAIATGKDGIQALLIEEAIPEIEQEANYLLSRLTNNQAQVFIESLRDLKKGGTKETLDIKISDQAGIRPYELFSGGEAFRIDFALRIAISKLLARRAGTALQTLIIDEGFGSQDEEGLSHIMDALHKIQNDFSRIIIVSHLSAMKDQFPVQFLVKKGIQGSTITVIEQG